MHSHLHVRLVLFSEGLPNVQLSPTGSLLWPTTAGLSSLLLDSNSMLWIYAFSNSVFFKISASFILQRSTANEVCDSELHLNSVEPECLSLYVWKKNIVIIYQKLSFSEVYWERICDTSPNIWETPQRRSMFRVAKARIMVLPWLSGDIGVGTKGDLDKILFIWCRSKYSINTPKEADFG